MPLPGFFVMSQRFFLTGMGLSILDFEVAFSDFNNLTGIKHR